MAIKFWGRILSHGLALAILDIAGVLFGFGVYGLLRPVNQVAVQAPAAAAAVVAGTVTGTWLLARAGLEELSLRSSREAVWVYLLALAWAPAVFVPLHFLGRGYLTSLGNLVGLALFQVPANALALFAAGWLVGWRPETRPESPDGQNASMLSQ